MPKRRDKENKFSGRYQEAMSLEKLRYPIAWDGYAETVDSTATEEIQHYLDRFGMVVIPILSAEEQSLLLDAFFEEFNEQQRSSATHKLSLDPLTWGSQNWPSTGPFLCQRPALGLQPTLVRTHPVIRQVFANIFGTDELVTSIDRWGAMRGSVGVPTQQEDGSISYQDHPEWRKNLELHWDMNPFAYAQEKKVGACQHRYQALVAVLDNPKEVGGLRVVPGSHRHYLEEWAGRNKVPKGYSLTSPHSVKLPGDDPAQHLSQKIPIKAGDMVVFDSRLLHGTFQNESQSMRLVQYIRMMPISMAEGDRFSATQSLKKHPDWRQLFESYGLDSQARRLLGL
mmetsp:Transcript_14464/g.21317  ORF Transcript_14464/g.21317 Transcript_14464/m.21317 type:complete len:340 (+) Transcript_14464:16-1035(+)